MRHHDGWVQTLKVQSRDRRVIGSGLRLQYSSTLVPRLVFVSVLKCRYQVSQFPRFFGQLTEYFYLLTSFHEIIEGYPRSLGHLQEIHESRKSFQESVGQERILDTVLCDFTKFHGVTLNETSKHLFGWHVNLLVTQIEFRHVIEFVRVQLVLLLDFLKQIKVKPSRCRYYF